MYPILSPHGTLVQQSVLYSVTYLRVFVKSCDYFHTMLILTFPPKFWVLCLKYTRGHGLRLSGTETAKGQRPFASELEISSENEFVCHLEKR
jgi:hypothetical protein